MQPFTAVAIFCEDIREEKNDIITLIGLVPDTVEVEALSGGGQPAGGETRKFLSNKLCIYVRINFNPDDDLTVSEIRLVMPDDTSIKMAEIEHELIDKAKSDAKTKGNVLAGIISRAALQGFSPPNGAIRVEADINGQTYLIGALTFKYKS